MPAWVQCKGCGREAEARIIEDDPSTNAFECEPEWADEDHEPTTCPHDEYDVIEVDHSDPFDQ